MKIALTFVWLMAIIFFSSFPIFAAPTRSNNPNTVAHYDTGPHGIPGESEFHEGSDIVTKSGNNGNFQQWFYGNSESEGMHGEHSVWRNVEKSTSCPLGWTLYENPYPEWGYYLSEGDNYCVKTNDFSSK